MSVKANELTHFKFCFNYESTLKFWWFWQRNNTRKYRKTSKFFSDFAVNDLIRVGHQPKASITHPPPYTNNFPDISPLKGDKFLSSYGGKFSFGVSGIITYKRGSAIKLINFLFEGSYRLFYRTFFGVLRVMDLIKGHLTYSCPSLKSIVCIFDKPNLLTEKTNLPNLRVMGLIAGYRRTMP